MPTLNAAANKQHIVILVTTDDLDVNTFNEALAGGGLMPFTKTLIVDPGVIFDNSFVPISECCPYRATQHSGQYAQNNNVRGNGPPLGGVANFNHQTALAVSLKKAGVLSTHVGKWLNLYGRVPSQPGSSPYSPAYVLPGWTTSQPTVDNSSYTGFEHIFSVNGVLTDDRPAGVTRNNYLTNVIATRAISWVLSVAEQQKPMFISVAPAEPHFNLTNRDSDPPSVITLCPDGTAAAMWGVAPEASPDYKGTIDINQPQGPAFNEPNATLASKPLWVRNRNAMTSTDIACLNMAYRRKLEAMRSIDDLVGGLASYIDSLGLYRNVTWIFTSDNGYMRGEHRLIEKLAPYEESIRVPLIIAGPGYPARHVSQMVNAADLAPTIEEIFRATSLVTVDGRSLVPLLKGQIPSVWRNAMLVCGYEATVDGGVQAVGYPLPHSPFCGIRMINPPRLFTRYEPTSTEPSNTELYDLGADPAELFNLNTDPGHARDLQQLDAMIPALKTCAGQTCRNLENNATIH